MPWLNNLDSSPGNQVYCSRLPIRVGRLEVGTPFTKPLWSLNAVEYGGFYDGTRLGVELNPTYNVSPSLELSATYQFNRIDFKDRGELFEVHLARLKALVMFSTAVSLDAFLQYNSLSKAYSGNVRLRYNPREGNDFYIVYNENLNTDLDRELPILPRTNARTLLLKYSYTIRA